MAEKKSTNKKDTKKKAEDALMKSAPVGATPEEIKDDIKELSPEERKQFVKTFNENENNIGRIKLIDEKPDDAYVADAEKAFNDYVEEYNNTTLQMSNGDAFDVVDYLIDLVKNHSYWTGAWWATFLHFVRSMEDYKKEIESGKMKELSLDFATVFATHEILKNPKGDYEDALFFEETKDLGMKIMGRLHSGYNFIVQKGKNASILNDKLNLAKTGFKSDITIMEEEGGFDINECDKAIDKEIKEYNKNLEEDK